jgi:hypothetical protein
MATWSDWFKSAEQFNLPLDTHLNINTAQDIDRLTNSGLPHFDSIIIKGSSFDRESIKDFAARHPNTWMRVVNKQTGKRQYKIGMYSFDEIMGFIKSLNIDIAEHDFQLFENCDERYGGNVITENNSTVIEIVEGKQDLVGKSKVPFFHGFISSTGRLFFHEHHTPLKMKKAARSVLKHLKIARDRHIPGYFEFLVSKQGRVYFLDYKLGFK